MNAFATSSRCKGLAAFTSAIILAGLNEVMTGCGVAEGLGGSRKMEEELQRAVAKVRQHVALAAPAMWFQVRLVQDGRIR
jgi:hypothetical protein